MVGSTGRNRYPHSPNRFTALNCQQVVGPILQPRRIVESCLEAPDPLNSVPPLAACDDLSRLGPAVEGRDGVFQIACAGKYNRDLDDEHTSLDASSHLCSSSAPCALHCNAEALRPPAPNQLTTDCPNNDDDGLPSRRPEPAPIMTTRSSTDDVLNIYYQNVGGLNSCLSDYLLASSDCCYDILVFTETWLTPATISGQVLDRQYEVFRCDRGPHNSRKARGGGVLVAIRRGINALVIEDDAWTSVEQIWLEIELADRKLYLCVIYIPPDRTRDIALIEAHTDSVALVVNRASPTDDIVILGDFNLPGVCWRASNNGFLYPDAGHSSLNIGTICILDRYSTATLQQINNVVNENGRSLDLCFVSSRDVAPSITSAPTPLVKLVAHHPPLHLSIDTRNLAIGQDPISPVLYDFRKADYEKIIHFLSMLDWEHILGGNDVNASAQTFSHILLYAIDQYVPKKVVTEGRAPWMTPVLRKLKRQKKAALRRYSKNKCLVLRDHYVRLNSIYKRASTESYRRYQINIQRQLKSRPKSFWNFVKEQRKERGLPSSMKHNGNVTSEPQAICDMFAAKFSSIFSDELLTDRQISSAASNTQASGLVLPEVTVSSDSVKNAASKLKASMGLGPDGIPSMFLKKCIDCLLEPLVAIFNQSLSSGVFPLCWKSAFMFPVHKKGDKKNIDNYRGISSLCAISKLFELVVMDRLFFHCKQSLSLDQHGFIPGRSTASNLLCLTSYVTDSMLDRAQTDVVYLDLTAAFDKINHQIAVAKLEKLGVNGTLLDWFRSYLNDRRSQVITGDQASETFPITSGIPQGSHLGPLIFLLYFNDVNAVLDGPRLSFADDFKLYFKIRSCADALFLQQQLDSFADWCQKNRMAVNPEKCSVITFTRLKKPVIYNYYFSGVLLGRVDEIKDLGVILDSQLTFKQHVSYAVDKASKTLGFVFRITKSFSDVYCLKALYCALVRSILEYCSTVWSPLYQNGAERIESVQRRFVRFALRRLPWRDPLRLPSYEDRCRLIDLDSLDTRRNVSKALLVSDVLQGRIDCPRILQQINFYVQPRALRNNTMLRTQTHRTNYGANSAISGLQRVFNRVSHEFDFNVSRDALRGRFFNVLRQLVIFFLFVLFLIRLLILLVLYLCYPVLVIS